MANRSRNQREQRLARAIQQRDGGRYTQALVTARAVLSGDPRGRVAHNLLDGPQGLLKLLASRRNFTAVACAADVDGAEKSICKTLEVSGRDPAILEIFPTPMNDADLLELLFFPEGLHGFTGMRDEDPCQRPDLVHRSLLVVNAERLSQDHAAAIVSLWRQQPRRRAGEWPLVFVGAPRFGATVRAIFRSDPAVSWLEDDWPPAVKFPEPMEARLPVATERWRHFGELLTRERREVCGMDRKELAQRAGVELTTVARIEGGDLIDVSLGEVGRVMRVSGAARKSVTTESDVLRRH